MSVAEITVRVVCSFFALLILTRLMGKKEIGQLTFFNFISAIAIGDIAAVVTLEKSIDLKGGLLALLGWALLTLITGFISIKSKNARRLLNGQPIILIKQGKILEKHLRDARLEINTLLAMLRQKDVFSIEDVEYAIFEIDGKLSVLKKESEQPATRSDLNIQQSKINLFPIPTELISDGKINRENLAKLHLDENWLQEQIKRAGASSTLDVFYAEIQRDGTLYVDKREDNLH
ncbi:DUF421 domain-containing protein [Aneurinibacillus sp. Ricciae_BoGa-3]|uniref:YetF domain-containing protein n=1 Tax=Aneurinibacillus sp. Ricciae_BoGa-3 TaxID=3022697 RepID=UPI002340F50E|nr:DUF421 domain-containing protein [Aneurinibacillus sp. Ricciae_BoGa-3]WCK54307.1 DUF421 domain-containing protein [Aneurinibacillus sp. Ricciae_BoGa-3]